MAAVLGAGTAALLPQATAAGGPGSLVDSAPLSALPQGAGSGYSIHYTSTGVGGAPTEVSGVVYLPTGTPPPGGWRVLSWAHGTTGLGDACAPSRLGPDGYLAGWLKAGYAVVATDYAGLGTPGDHPYLDGKVAAHGVIDAVRAGRELRPGELSSRWVVAGQSQGGHAAVFTGHEAAGYAPELDFLGTIGHGVPSNLSYFVSLIGPTFPPNLVGTGTKTLVAYILAGLRAAVPSFPLDDYLTQQGKDVVSKAAVLCGGELGALMAQTDLATLFTKNLGTEFQQAWGSVFDVPVTGYDKPLFIAQGTNDGTVPASLTQQLVDALKANGQPLTYKTYPSDHGGTPGAALTDALAFADGLFAAAPPTTTPPTTPPTTTPPTTTPPQVVTAKVRADRQPDANGWYTKPFTATWYVDAADPQCTATTYGGPDTATGSLEGDCPNPGGGRTAKAPFAFRYDGTAPTAALASNGFVRSVTGSAGDATSGVASVQLTVTELLGKKTTVTATCAPGCASWTAPGVRGLVSVSATAVDAAGNRSAATPARWLLVY
ncbi:hypothetical protein BJP25_27145 [Actinokineospora bangkokensis]|uniref:Lipase n=1 Tax=Actinokineospora bangkokensis TaxID=1193682 RepID=A0A1Q9LH44_9PSEU|nr:hypothetical protein BJP25_27145 [Actinokineospora bangkokensis]